MNEHDRVTELEQVLAKFLKPIRGIPFPVIVRVLASSDVIEVDRKRDRSLIDALVKTAHHCAELVRKEPIVRPRPNEVGNDVEPFVRKAAKAQNLPVERPVSKSGKAKTTGYPDLLLRDRDGQATYLECKTFAHGASLTPMRSFYLSPSEEFKVCEDARHILMAFGVERTQMADSINSEYILASFKLVDLHGLLCDVKYEFNSDNKRLYERGMVLAEGSL